jgi:hypothetical protein
MGLVKLFGPLRGWLADDKPEEPGPGARISALLAELEARERALEEALLHERRTAKRRRLHQALEVVRLQQRKGIARREALGVDRE